MKKIVVLATLCLLLISCSLPFTINLNTATPEPIGPPETQVPTAAPQEDTPVPVTTLPFAGTEYNLGGVYMVVPECLAVVPSGVIVPAVPYDATSGPMEYFPQHRRITFTDYPLSGKSFEPIIRVYPVVDYTAMNDEVGGHVSALQTLLALQDANPDHISILPQIFAGQVFRARIGYFPFQNGSGVRFLTEYAQYHAPVINDDLFYTYQGLTTDGLYWVAAIFPVNAPWLQETWDSTTVPADGVPAPAMDSTNLEAEMDAYYKTIIDRLNTADAEGFTPSTLCLDQFMQSLSVGN